MTKYYCDFAYYNADTGCAVGNAMGFDNYIDEIPNELTPSDAFDFIFNEDTPEYFWLACKEHNPDLRFTEAQFDANGNYTGTDDRLYTIIFYSDETCNNIVAQYLFRESEIWFDRHRQGL